METPIGKGIKIGLIVILIAGAAGFFYLFLKPESKPKTEPTQTHWRYKVKSNRPMPVFTQKSETYYTFVATGQIYGMNIDGRYYNVSYVGADRESKYKTRTGFATYKYWDGVKDKFSMKFDQARGVSVNFEMKGTWVKDGYIDIYKYRNNDLPRLLYLIPDRYNNLTLNVQKGQRIDLLKQKELFYLAYFNNGQEVERDLIKNDREYYFRFWNNRQIKFISAEAPFVFVLTKASEPYFEDLVIRGLYGSGQRSIHKTKQSRAWFLKEGELKKTNIWLDKDDLVLFFSYSSRNNDNRKNKIKKILFVSTGGADCKESYQGFRVARDGYASIGAKRQCAIVGVDIFRNKHWELKLRSGQAKKIKVYSGDIINFYSESRYFFNGEIVEAKKTYSYRFHNEKFIEFKGSIEQKTIWVWVKARRGH